MSSTAEDDEPGAAASAAHTGYDLGRLFAFSDGVFAIAITLLVLTIPVPSVTENALPGKLADLGPSLAGFGLSFWLVGTLWIAHHRLLRQLDFCDGTILWVNLLLLMGVCLVPFASSLLARYGGGPAGVIPYAALQAAIGIVFLSLRLYLLHHGVDMRDTLRLSWLPVVTFLVSIPLALLNPNLAFAAWLAGLVISRASGRSSASSLLGRLRRLNLPWTRSPS
jgi:uncharacterized membrane protein